MPARARTALANPRQAASQAERCHSHACTASKGKSGAPPGASHAQVPLSRTRAQDGGEALPWRDILEDSSRSQGTILPSMRRRAFCRVQSFPRIPGLARRIKTGQTQETHDLPLCQSCQPTPLPGWRFPRALTPWMKWTSWKKTGGF